MEILGGVDMEILGGVDNPGLLEKILATLQD